MLRDNILTVSPLGGNTVGVTPTSLVNQQGYRITKLFHVSEAFADGVLQMLREYTVA